MTKHFKKIIIFLTTLIIIMTFILINIILSNQNSVANKVAKLEDTGDFSSDIFYLTKDNYPDNPYDVISLYLEAYSLIYGDFISNQEVISILLEQQRLLLDETILNRNSLSSQKKSLFESLGYLIESNFRISYIEIEEPYFTSEDENEVAVKVIKVDNNQEVYNFKYYLKLDSDGYWKITNWERDNNKYMIEN